MKKWEFLDNNDNVVMEIDNTKKLCIKEDVIIKKSIEWFGDPDPCILHRSAVNKKAILELIDQVENIQTNNSENWHMMDIEIIDDYIALLPNVTKAKIYLK